MSDETHAPWDSATRGPRYEHDREKAPISPSPDYESAWRSLSEPLSWMHECKALSAYWGWNLADVANDLIRRAYPELAAAPARDDVALGMREARVVDAAKMLLWQFCNRRDAIGDAAEMWRELAEACNALATPTAPEAPPVGVGEDNYRQWAASDPDNQPDGTLESLATCASMLEQFGPDCFPANEQGQVHFARVMMDSTAAEIRAYLVKGLGNVG